MTSKSLFFYLTVFCLSIISPVDASDELVQDLAPIRVGAFNIQDFGKRKMQQPDVVASLVKIIRRYDVVLLQEISDLSGEAIRELLATVNDHSQSRYTMLLSSRLGHSNQREQYAYFYRENRVNFHDVYEYEDLDDLIERDPFVASFWVKQQLVVMIGVHVRPLAAVPEINELANVASEASNFYDTNSVVILGDLNADCAYVSDNSYAELDLVIDKNWNWHFSRNDDTTVGESDCAYDHMITFKDESFLVAPVIYDFQEDLGLTLQQAKSVSDHYPVEAFIGE